MTEGRNQSGDALASLPRTNSRPRLPSTSQFSRFAFAGFTDQGIISSRPWQKISPDLTATQSIEAARGVPLAKDAVGAQSDETIIEARYNISIDKGLSVMPDLQYVIHPGAGRTYDNALVLALQIKTDF